MNNSDTVKNIIIIGASTGGTRVLSNFFSELPVLNAAIIIVQHIPAFHCGLFAESLDRLSPMKVVLADNRTTLENHTVYCAPSDTHLILIDNSRIKLIDGEKVNFCKPSIDVTMKSLNQNQCGRIVGVLLTGMGKDGSDGISHIKAIGGFTIAQDKDSCVIYGMPKAAIETGKVDYILHQDNIPRKLIALVGKKLGN